MKQIYSITKLVYFALICAFIASGCNQEIESGNGSIHGKILDAGSKVPVEDCEIILAPGNSIVTSDNSGSFKFSDIPSGEYSVIFNHRDYHTQIVTAKVITRLVTMLNVELESKTPYSISCDELNFGEIDTRVEFTLKNHTSSNCSFSISNEPSWLTLSPSSGKISSGGKQIISATINRDNFKIGEHRATLNISFDGSTNENCQLNVVALKVNVSTPTVTCSSSITNLKESSVTLSGTIKSTGGAPITQYGHCWSTSPTPTIADSKTKLGESTSTKDFTSNITGLLPLTKYYVRAYATNSQGTSYSSEIISFTTPDVYSDVWDGEIATSFAGGSGTSVDPYIIKTGGQLLLMEQYSNSSYYFVLANNIDLNRMNWKPFILNGTFDGQGHIISNLYIDRASNYQGLFSKLDLGAKVKNLTIKGVQISAPQYDYIGAIAGYANTSSYYNGYIENCTVILDESSIIKGKARVGGITGDNGSSLINCRVTSLSSEYNILGDSYVGGICGEGGCKQCIVTANIKGGSYIGGISGYTYSDYIQQCSYQGKLQAVQYVGGICGYLGYNSSVYTSKANAEIIVDSKYAGGITGYMTSTTIGACYSTGCIDASSSTASVIGGIVGDASSYSKIYSSYSTVRSTTSSFDGISPETYSDCLTVKASCTPYVTNVYGTNIQGYCTDITTYMKECYSDYASYWNFDNTWTWRGIVNGQEVSVSCPRLAWE